MTIKEFIKKDILQSRLEETGVLVVYDSLNLYKDICQEFSSKKCKVIDCSDSSIESREESYSALQQIGNQSNKLHQLLVYIPKEVTKDEREKLKDPFWIFAEMGRVFPDPKLDGDSYLQICLKAKPEYNAEIRRIFEENPTPGFEVIDAIGGGKEWPTLRSLLGEESVTEIILSILKPSNDQKNALNSNNTWISELKNLLKASFGQDLKTKAKQWEPIADELWGFILYSELALSLESEEPKALQSISRAVKEAKPLITKICENLRQDRRKIGLYIDKSKEIEESFSLASNFEGVADDGIPYTFSFKERRQLEKVVHALLATELDTSLQILEGQTDSIWSDVGDNQLEWQIVRSAYSVIRECGDREKDFSDHVSSASDLFDYYAHTFREVDRAHRSFEQVWNEYKNLDDNLIRLAEHVRNLYRSLTEKVQLRFMDLVSEEGWPLPGKKFSPDLFDLMVGKKVEKSGYRVAYIMTDALRYELAEVLEQSLSSYGSVQLEAVCAQLPTITPVGMASLLPDAGGKLNLELVDGKIVTKLNGEVVNDVRKRLNIFKKRFGARFTENKILDFIKKRSKIPKETELLVLRSMDIDSHLENNPETTLKLIPDSIRNIQAAVNRLRKEGFQEVFIVTDHGFFLNHHAGPGDVCKKPNGNWVMVHDRMLVGDGDKDDQNVLIPVEKAGIKGNFSKIACPRTMAPYKEGELFFHGGLSLQEAVVPIISIILKEEKSSDLPVDLKLSYRGGLEKINARMPVFQLEAEKKDLFFEGDIDVKVIVEDEKGEPIGEVQPGGAVNPASGLVSVKPGYSAKVIVRMQEDFEGNFVVKVQDPNTDITYTTLELETDYVV